MLQVPYWLLAGDCNSLEILGAVASQYDAKSRDCLTDLSRPDKELGLT